MKNLFAVGMFVLGSLATCQAQGFALYSPGMVQALPAQKDTAAGKAIIKSATADLKETPHPMARIHTEGTLQHQGIRDESFEAVKDFDKIEHLAFAYRLTGDLVYLAKVNEFMDAWATVYKVSGNPIDETHFDFMYLAFDVVRGKLDKPVEEHVLALFQGFTTRYLDWLDANYAKDTANWSSHRVKLAMLGALESGDRDLIARAARANARQVHQNLRADGSVDDFYKRDALHYVVYDLEPLTVVALAVKAHKQDCFHTASAGSPSLEMAVDWLVPYAMGEKTHEEFVHSSVGFDAARAKAGEKGYDGMWEASTSRNLFQMAAWLDPKYAPVVAKLGGTLQPWIALGQR